MMIVASGSLCAGRLMAQENPSTAETPTSLEAAPDSRSASITEVLPKTETPAAPVANRPVTQDPIVAKIDLTVRLKGEVIDNIVKGDLLHVITEREKDYIIQTLSGKKSVIAKDSAVRLPDAVPVYDELILQSPEEGRLYTLRASAHWANGSAESALADFDKAIEMGYQESHAYASRGLFHSATGDSTNAIADFSKAIEKDPKNEVPMMNRASVYMALGEYQPAVADYTQAMEIRPENPVLYSQRAVAHKLLGQLDKALSDYDQAISLVDKDVSAWLGRGFVKFQMGQHQAAVDDFSQVIQMAPQSAVAYNNRGYNYQMLKQFEKALQDYQRAIELAPGYVLALQNRAWLLTVCEQQTLRDSLAAMEIAKSVNEISEYKDLSDLTLLAATYAAADDFETAIGWQEKAVEIAEGEQRATAQKILSLYQDRKPIDPALLVAPLEPQSE
jgi:tetratricopeptide (TPR) repeat protein